MVETTAKTTEYISQSYATMRAKLSFRAKKVLAKIESISRISEESWLRLSYARLAEMVTCTSRHAIRIIKKLKDKGYITQSYDHRQACAGYRDEREKDETGFVRVAPFLYERCFTFTYTDDETGKTVSFERCLIEVEVVLLSLMAEHCMNSRKYEGTMRQMASMLGTSTTSIQGAINSLMACGAISRSKKKTSRSRKEKSVYYVDGSILRKIRTFFEEIKSKRKAKKRAPSFASSATVASQATALKEKPAWKQQIEELDARTERERYYALLREKAVKRVERVQAKLELSEEYKACDRAIKIAELQIAKFEFSGDTLGAHKVKEEQTCHFIRRNKIIREMGYSPGDLVERYCCKLCDDTGYDKLTGKACSCYPKGKNE